MSWVKPPFLGVTYADRKFVLQLRIGKSSTSEIHKLSIMAKRRQPATSANFLSAKLFCAKVVSNLYSSLRNNTD